MYRHPKTDNFLKTVFDRHFLSFRFALQLGYGEECLFQSRFFSTP